jgi:hypothetical protein
MVGFLSRPTYCIPYNSNKIIMLMSIDTSIVDTNIC